jgi:hypothetical protein
MYQIHAVSLQVTPTRGRTPLARQGTCEVAFPLAKALSRRPWSQTGSTGRHAQGNLRKKRFIRLVQITVCQTQIEMQRTKTIGMWFPTVAKLRGTSCLLQHNTCACHVLVFMKCKLVLVHTLNFTAELFETMGPCQELRTQGLNGSHVGTCLCSDHIESSYAP